jgi:hypothetical protein
MSINIGTINILDIGLDKLMPTEKVTKISWYLAVSYAY